MIDKWQHQNHGHDRMSVGIFIVLAGSISLYKLVTAHIEVMPSSTVKIRARFLVSHGLQQIILIVLIRMLHDESSLCRDRDVP